MDYPAIVRDATARKREIIAELEKLDALIASAAALAGAPIPSASSAVPVAVRRAASPLGSPTRIAVADILREVNKPMQTRELVPLVRGKGIEVGGKDPIATLSARLSNSAEFRLIKGSGWWFKDEPLPGSNELGFEVADATAKDESTTSVSDQGGSEDAAALVSDDLDDIL